MKNLALVILLCISLFGNAQNPVTWEFRCEKIKKQEFRIHMKATIQAGWHLFSQTQPDNAIVTPTTFTINKNPIIVFEAKFLKDGKLLEMGQLERFTDKKLGISADQYSEVVDFVLTVKTKADVVTNFNGNLEFQTCNDEKCLPPKRLQFNLVLK